MAGKSKRNQQHKEEEQLEDSENSTLDAQDIRRMISEEQSRLAENKVAEEERAEARRVAAEERADKRRREERLEDEKRKKEERIEDEERAERRAEARLKREEERAEERAEAKRQRKLEEARLAVELEAVKEAAAKIAAERMEESAKLAAQQLLEQQQAMSDRQFKQQEQLMKLQAEMSARADNERRVDAERTKKNERAVSSIMYYKDVDDIEEYLTTAERKLRAGEVPEREWLTHIAAKLTGKMGTTWQDLCIDVVDYQEVKAKLLKICGYTPKVAGELFFGFKADQIRGMTADQVYHRGVQLFRRLIAPNKCAEELEFSILKCWVAILYPRGQGLP